MKLYPELVEKKDYIQKIIAVEEQKFASTIDQGTSIIGEYVEELKKRRQNTAGRKKVFKLYDTFGFPLELTEEILAEAGRTADVDGFNANMQRQKEMARAGRKSTDEEAWKEAEAVADVPDTVFTGYEKQKT